MKRFEMFIQKDKISFSDWQKLEEKIFEYEKRFVIELVFETNSIGFYLYSQKDLSLISEKLEDFLLKPTGEFVSDEEKLAKRISFRLDFNKDILEIKEKEQIRNNRTIEKIRVNFYKFLFLKFYKLVIFFVDKKRGVLSSSYFTLNNPLINCQFDFKRKIKLRKKSPPIFLKIDRLEELFTPFKNLGFLKEAIDYLYYYNTIKEYSSLGYQMSYAYLKQQLPAIDDTIRYVQPFILDDVSVKLGPWSGYNVLADYQIISILGVS